MSDDLPSNCLEVDGIAYCVAVLPGRKRVSLFRQRGNTVIDPAASFTDSVEAEMFREWLIDAGRIAQHRGDLIARIRAACEPLMSTTVAVTERWGEDVVEVPAALWHQWRRDMEALLSKEDGE